MFTAVTRAITVQAEPQFEAQATRPEEGRFVWAYTITITNHGETPTQLLSRHWIVTDARGLIQEVRGQGVIGKQPRLLPGEQFRYTSSVVLATESGLMYGRYTMVNDDGERYEIDVPAFPLEAPTPSQRAN